MQVVGTLLVWYVLSALPLTRTMRKIALSALTIGTLTPLLGANYTMFRFAAPYAAFLYATKPGSSFRAQWLRLACCQVVMLAILLPVLSEMGKLRFYLPIETQVLTTSARGNGFDMARLSSVTRGAKVFMPIKSPPAVRRELQAKGQWQSSYFCNLQDAETFSGVGIKIREYHQASYVLVPEPQSQRDPKVLEVDILHFIHLKYRVTRPMFHPGSLIYQDLATNYVPVATFRGGPETYVLFRPR